MNNMKSSFLIFCTFLSILLVATAINAVNDTSTITLVTMSFNSHNSDLTVQGSMNFTGVTAQAGHNPVVGGTNRIYIYYTGINPSNITLTDNILGDVITYFTNATDSNNVTTLIYNWNNNNISGLRTFTFNNTALAVNNQSVQVTVWSDADEFVDGFNNVVLTINQKNSSIQGNIDFTHDTIKYQNLDKLAQAYNINGLSGSIDFQSNVLDQLTVNISFKEGNKYPTYNYVNVVGGQAANIVGGYFSFKNIKENNGTSNVICSVNSINVNKDYTCFNQAIDAASLNSVYDTTMDFYKNGTFYTVYLDNGYTTFSNNTIKNITDIINDNVQTLNPSDFFETVASYVNSTGVFSIGEITSKAITLTNSAGDVTYDLPQGNLSVNTSQVPLISGTYTVTVKAADKYGNTALKNMTVILDIVPTMTVEFNALHTILNNNGIASNINTCGDNPTNCVGLYFEKTGYGQISFNDPLDMTSATTIALMQNLGNKLNMTKGVIGLDATTASIIKNANATLTMYGLPYTSTPNIRIFDDNNVEIININLTGINNNSISYNNVTGTLIFNTSHFTTFRTEEIKTYAANNTVTQTYTQIVMDNTTKNINSTITVSQNVTEVTLDLGALSIVNNVTNITTVNVVGTIDATVNTTSGIINIAFPANITISGGSTWDGSFALPKLLLIAAANATPDSGYTAATNLVIKVGTDSENLTFDKAVRLVLPGMSGKSAGFQRGTTFTKIVNTCSADTQSAGDALSLNSECVITVGSDLAIWTKHFTDFVAYTQTVIPCSGCSCTNSCGGGGGGGVYTPKNTTTTVIKNTTIETTPSNVTNTTKVADKLEKYVPTPSNNTQTNVPSSTNKDNSDGIPGITGQVTSDVESILSLGTAMWLILGIIILGILAFVLYKKYGK